MHLFAFGINHHTAPLEIRERAAIPSEMIAHMLTKISMAYNEIPVVKQSKAFISDHLLNQKYEITILSTCNRTELYFAGPRTIDCETILNKLLQAIYVDANDLKPYIYTLYQKEVVQHAFRVASGLNSMVLGETQILGQLKNAVRIAEKTGTLGVYLHRLFQYTFATAKAVRSQTAICRHSTSIAATAVKIAERIFENFTNQKILFVGAGEMIELCATHFAAQRPAQMVITNRNMLRSQRLAEKFNASVIAFSDLPHSLENFDIVISSTASTLPIIGLGAVKRALRLRRRRPILMIDLAVPRDVEAEVAELEDIFLYTIDDLSEVIGENNALRQAAAHQAEHIIADKVTQYMHWLQTRDVVPVINLLKQHADQIRRNELLQAKKALAQGNSFETVLENFSHAICNKFLHGTFYTLNHSQENEKIELIELLPKLFGQAQVTKK